MISNAEQNRRWRSKYPEKVKAQRIRYLDKKIKNNPEEFKAFENKFRQMFNKLTRLMFNDELPKFCAVCGSFDDLQIHHIRYVYPIIKKDIVRLCSRCHIEEHQKTNPYFKREGMISCGDGISD